MIEKLTPEKIESTEHKEKIGGAVERVEKEETRKSAWETIESVGKRIGNSEWYRSLFGDKSKKQLEKQGVSPSLVEQLIQKLEQGRYIGPLETQPVSWSDTKIYRDIVQNFFDGMKGVVGRPTLDGVEFGHQTIGKGEESQVEFTIQSPAEYDHRYLLHHGGTTKLHDEDVVGEFGEGLKIASFLLTKQGVTDRIELGSDHWKACYYLNELPKEEYPEKVRGLYLRAEFVKNGVEGNYLRFRTDKRISESVQRMFKKMQDLFWHKGHPDFQNPTFENDFGGFKFLPKYERGNLYVSGQRHEYDRDEAWSNAVPGANVWTFKKALEKTRDRNYAVSWDVKSKIIRPIIESMTKKDLLAAFQSGKEYWIASDDREQNMGREQNIGDEIFEDIVTNLAEKLSEKEKKELLKEFPEELFVKYGGENTEYEKALESIGYSPCKSVFSSFGVLNARKKIVSLIETGKEPKLEKWEEQRVDILKSAIQAFIESAGSRIIDKYEKFLRSPVDKKGGFTDWDFDAWERLSVHDVLGRISRGDLPKLTIRETDSLQLKKGGGSIELRGFTTLFPENIFLQRKLLRGNFLGALFTWSHELAHNISGEGNDFKARFTDAERYLHELLLITSFESDKLKQLQKEWEEIRKEENIIIEEDSEEGEESDNFDDDSDYESGEEIFYR